MNSADVFEQIEKMGELPSLPQTLLQIQTVADDLNSSAEDLAQCILKDQALTMRVLKVVNSAMYQRPDQDNVRTVRRAVIVIGFENVRKLALGLSVFDMMSKLSRSPYLATIARHSLITAGLAQVLADACSQVESEEAFVTALVHDIGKVVLLECSPAAMDQVLADVAEGTPLLDAERRHYGITHVRAGRRLAARWSLPNSLQSVIGDHHDIDPLNPPRNLDPMLGVIAYADAMSSFEGKPEDQSGEYKILRKAGRALGIPSSRMENISLQVSDKIADLADLVGLDLGELCDYSSVVNVDGGVIVAPRRMTAEEIARRTASQLDLYRRIGHGLAGSAGQDELLDLILEGIVEILGFERVVLLKADRSDHTLTPVRWAGMQAEALAVQMDFPLARSTGALALAVIEHRLVHVPMAASPAYHGLAGDELLAVAQCTGFVAAPVNTAQGTVGVIYADCGPGSDDVEAEPATELAGLAQQVGLVLAAKTPAEVA